MFTANLIIKFSIMLKNILNLNGAQELSKNEQKSLIGGGPGDCLQGCNSQWDCEQAGGQWVSVGTSNCGCVFGGPIGPNHK